MKLQSIIDYCSAKPGAVKEFPFDDTTLVIKAGRKMFALIKLSEPYRINLKCDPLYALELRKQYHAVSAGYHMNKKHWNTVSFDGDVSESLLQEWIGDSYQLVVNGMTKKEREKLENLNKPQ